MVLQDATSISDGGYSSVQYARLRVAAERLGWPEDVGHFVSVGLAGTQHHAGKGWLVDAVGKSLRSSRRVWSRTSRATLAAPQPTTPQPPPFPTTFVSLKHATGMVLGYLPGSWGRMSAGHGQITI